MAQRNEKKTAAKKTKAKKATPKKAAVKKTTVKKATKKTEKNVTNILLSRCTNTTEIKIIKWKL